MWKIQKLIMTASIAGALVVALVMPATSAAACLNNKRAAIETVDAASAAAVKAIKAAGVKGLIKSKKYTFSFKASICSGTVSERDFARAKKPGSNKPVNKSLGVGTRRVSNPASYNFPVSITVKLTGGGVKLLKAGGKITITTTTFVGSFRLFRSFTI
jgi:hypothetical protein